METSESETIGETWQVVALPLAVLRNWG